MKAVVVKINSDTSELISIIDAKVQILPSRVIIETGKGRERRTESLELLVSEGFDSDTKKYDLLGLMSDSWIKFNGHRLQINIFETWFVIPKG